MVNFLVSGRRKGVEDELEGHAKCTCAMAPFSGHYAVDAVRGGGITALADGLTYLGMTSSMTN